MAIPNYDLGSLNRLKVSVYFKDYPELNISPFVLGEEGIELIPERDAVLMIEALVGLVASPEPFVPVSVPLPILKTVSLSNEFKKKIETNARVGEVEIYLDSTTLDSYKLTNCTISRFDGIRANGKDAVVRYQLKGTYITNKDLFNIV